MLDPHFAAHMLEFQGPKGFLSREGWQKMPGLKWLLVTLGEHFINKQVHMNSDNLLSERGGSSFWIYRAVSSALKPPEYTD